MKRSINKNKILRKVENTYKENEGLIPLAIFDHVSSTPALIVPVEALQKIAKS
jgi:hypothetical protein